MTVRAKMKCTSITKTGDAKKPQVQVKLGAVYSNDSESENRSFANATPSGELSMNIDAGRPAAEMFELGCEYYIDIIPVGIPERHYLGDYYQIPHGRYILESRDKSKQIPGEYGPQGWIVNGERITNYSVLGVEFWRHLKEGE